MLSTETGLNFEPGLLYSYVHSNRLSFETSPYLLQHAHNPVDWYPWGDDAFLKARSEDKPLLVSIGYSACHWCHVMERESFEDETVARYMNEHFVNVKIDREERPDLDHIYMDAVQAIAGNGGWPLNVFLLPDGRPFYGGTYFPPKDMPHRPSWTRMLEHISGLYRTDREGLDRQAAQLTEHIASANQFGLPGKKSAEDKAMEKETGLQPPSAAALFPEDLPSRLASQLLDTADPVHGGFGAAPKFPQTLSLRFLLQYHYYSRDALALKQTLLSLDKMILGGLNDQLGGGFARYSTDAEWLAPHFEKMLYDNALLVSVLCEAYTATHSELYASAINRTLEFVERELTGARGGFWSALDADSEGIEGKFYVWSKQEVQDLLGADAEAFCRVYDVTEEGNWEGQNILRVKDEADKLPAATDRICREKLLAARSRRIRPQTDDKVLLGWNALMITACFQAFAALREGRWLALGLRQLEFIETNLRGRGGEDFALYHHTWKNGKASIPAFLEDYAFFIQAYINAQEVTGTGKYLEKARTLTEYLMRYFSEEGDDYFVYTHENQDDVIFRKKEVYDGAVPSGNAVMAANLLVLGTIFDLPAWRERSSRMLTGLLPAMTRYPGSFGVWATQLLAHTYGIREIVLSGDPDPRKHQDFLAENIPNRIFLLSSDLMGIFPILRDKPAVGPARFFLCQNYACQPPVSEVTELIELLESP